MDGQLASAHHLPALYIGSMLYPNKPVNTEPLSVTVPVVIGTGTVLVGMVSYTRTATVQQLKWICKIIMYLLLFLSPSKVKW